MAQTADEEQRAARRRRTAKGLLLGGLALGVPALVNAVVARRARSLPRPRTEPQWERPLTHRWRSAAVRYRRLGSGRPLVLLHSFGPGHGSHEWRHAAPLLARSHEVFAPEFPGWGRSLSRRLALGAGIYLEWLQAFLDERVGAPAELLGVGRSGSYAVQIAADRPELVRSLTLIAPLGLEEPRRRGSAADRALHGLLRLPILGTSALNVYTSRRGVEKHLLQDVFADPDLARAETGLYYGVAHSHDAHRGLAAQLSGRLVLGVADALARTEVPVRLLWGRRCPNPPVEAADLWLRVLGAEGRLDILEDSALLPHAEEPERCVEILGD